jgi:hypothetical protein
MRKLITIAAAVVMFSGCAIVNKQVIDKSAVSALKSQTITHTTRKTPDFSAMTAGKAVFGLLAACRTCQDEASLGREDTTMPRCKKNPPSLR